MKKTFIFLTNRMLLGIVALSVAWTFTACSDSNEPEKEPVNDPNVIIAGEDDPLGEPIGIWYTDFRSENDVTITKSDTTELSISKALADSLGIDNFVNRPMGIWDKKEHTPYLRRATEQRLVGDRYVLKVVRSSLAEVIGSRDVMLNTGIYYDPSAPLSPKTRAAAFGDLQASMYVDDNDVIHPMAVTFYGQSDDGSNSEDGNWDKPYDLNETFTIAELYAMSKDPSNSIFDDFADWVKSTAKKVASAIETAVDYVVAKTTYTIDGEKSGALLHTDTKLTLKKKFSCGKESKDTIGVNFNCPVVFNLDYTIKAKAQGSIKTVGIPVPSYLETYVDGYLDVNPQLTVGFSKEISLPEDKQRVNLVKFTAVKYVFSIGPVPVSITITPGVYLKFTASLKGDAYIGISYDIATKFRAGFKYDGSFSGIGSGEVVKNEFDFLRPTVQVEAKAGVGLYFGADLIIEELAGPSFSVGPQVTADAKLKYVLPDDHLDFTAEAKAGIGGEVGGKISVFGFDLAEWKTAFDIGPQWTIFKYPDDGSSEKDNPSGKDYSSYNYIPIVGTGSSTGEYGYDKLLDGKKETEWRTSERIGGKYYVEFKSRKPITPAGYTLTTAHDTETNPYNPWTWKLYGKLHSYDDWELLDSQENGNIPRLNNAQKTFACSNRKECQYFRFEVTTSTGHGLTLSEFEFIEESMGNLNTLTSDYVAKNGDVITGTLHNDVKVSIADGATVMLDGATIIDTNSDNYKWAGITCLGNATIILKGENNVQGFHRYYPGIYVPKGKTLTIKGSGSLTATSGGSAPGIGATSYASSCGNIVIDGGTIQAVGGYLCPGIGGASNENCGDITITKNVTSVTATKGKDASFSIGFGYGSVCGVITIGGTVYYDGKNYQDGFLNGGHEYLETSPLVYKP